MSNTTLFPSSFSVKYRVRVSDISHAVYCFKQVKIRQQNREKLDKRKKNKYMKKGIEMHEAYSAWYKSFDRRLLLYKIKEKYGNVLKRRIEDIEVRGKFDDLRILLVYKKGRLKEKVVSVVEVKTTHKKFLYWHEREAAKFQLQIYLWLLEPILEELGYRLHTRHYVEIYSQKDGRLMKRIPVKEDKFIEDRITDIVLSWEGLYPMKYPELRTCKHCPKGIREQCDRWRYYFGDKKKKKYN